MELLDKIIEATNRVHAYSDTVVRRSSTLSECVFRVHSLVREIQKNTPTSLRITFEITEGERQLARVQGAAARIREIRCLLEEIMNELKVLERDAEKLNAALTGKRMKDSDDFDDDDDDDDDIDVDNIDEKI